MMSAKILLVEDDHSQAALLTLDLKRRGYVVDAAKSAGEAIKKLPDCAYDVVLTDLKLGDRDGLEVLAASKREQPETEVVVITGHGSIAAAVSAIKSGAFDFLTKPIEPEQLAIVLQKALEHRSLIGEVKRLREEVKGKYSFEGIVYASPEMHRALELVKKVAATDATVLVQGESGTGKELVARAIHENSARRSGSFVAINCGALPEGLLESELFGHVRGSFTGAERNKRGLFEEASGGTLFLDEISETTQALQVKLLRALQEGEIRRVGDNHPIKVSGRLITATNKDLAKHVKEGKFREDLYYRLKVFPILIPPLRERQADILPLAEHFIRKARKKTATAAVRLSPEAARAVQAYPWPGNVRELEHAIERALIMASDPAIAAEDLPPEVLAAVPVAPARTAAGATLDDMERAHILDVYEKCERNAAAAAKKLGIGRNTLWRKLKSYGIKQK
jgi:DNA-binding NtrC family response regulator